MNQEAPYAIQIELTLGCNLQCKFCGINGIQEQPGKGLKFMTMETAAIVASSIAVTGWNSRLELARRGEPTMNPEFIEIVRMLRRFNPKLQLMMTTNGAGFLRKPGPFESVKALFAAGLDILAIDEYEGINIVSKIRSQLPPAGTAFSYKGSDERIHVYDYPANKEGNPHRRTGEKFISFVEDIAKASKGTHSRLNNHAGFGAPLDDSYEGKRCAKPFREIGLNYDGSMDVCCIDWTSEYRIGNLYDTGLLSLWNSPEMQAARRYLIRGERSALRPCAGCNHPSYRVGLLPDKKGLATLPPPDAATAALVEATNARGPAVKPTRLALERVPTLQRR